MAEAQADLGAWIACWERKYPKLNDWVEENHMLERLNEELRRRTRVVRIFPNVASCLRLVASLVR